MNLEAPTELPKKLDLSHTSINLYLECPEKWRRRYIDRQYEPPVGVQVLGRAIHAAEAQSYHTMIETGQPHSLEQVLDDFTTTIDTEATKNTVDWQKETKGETKDRGAAMLAVYHQRIVPIQQPTKAEVKFRVKLHEDYKWGINGFIDLITSTDDGFIKTPSGPADIKSVRKAKNQVDVDNDMQATLYTYATMEEEEQEKTFRIHELKVLKDGAHATIIETTRTREAQMRYLERVAKVAREIEWRFESGNWQGAPAGAWWCRATSCGYYNSCPMANR